jgi:hypothetical protein
LTVSVLAAKRKLKTPPADLTVRQFWREVAKLGRVPWAQGRWRTRVADPLARLDGTPNPRRRRAAHVIHGNGELVVGNDKG